MLADVVRLMMQQAALENHRYQTALGVIERLANLPQVTDYFRDKKLNEALQQAVKWAKGQSNPVGWTISAAFNAANAGFRGTYYSPTPELWAMDSIQKALNLTADRALCTGVKTADLLAVERKWRLMDASHREVTDDAKYAFEAGWAANGIAGGYYVFGEDSKLSHIGMP